MINESETLKLDQDSRENENPFLMKIISLAFCKSSKYFVGLTDVSESDDENCNIYRKRSSIPKESAILSFSNVLSLL
jgi:hypothetical protein